MRLSAFLLSSSLLALVTSTVSATPIGAIGSFLEQGFADDRDIFTLTNTSDIGITIEQVSIDLGPAGLFLDTSVASGFPFTPDAGAALTGFTTVSGDSVGSTLLTMVFTDFDPGDSFTFFTDVDDGSGSGIVTGAEFAGTLLNVEFDGSIPLTLRSAAYAETGEFEAVAEIASSVPEPTTIALMGLGLAGLGFRRRKQAQ